MRDQAGEKGESEEAKADARTVKATVRRKPEEMERKKQRLSSEMLKLEAEVIQRKSSTGPGGEIQKGITCGTAAGAKQGRTKGNHQKSRVRKPGKKA